MKGNRNNKTLGEFTKAIERHVKSPDTIVIKGTYRRQPATHYYNPKTGINLMRDGQGNFWSAWKLGQEQAKNILKRGSL
ncbi:MAG: hypothetical protein MRY79_04045 [Alphaproteobacteria bacterium]|nr:hypothetical protein [Alphaproteobacteria bacterium]